MLSLTNGGQEIHSDRYNKQSGSSDKKVGCSFGEADFLITVFIKEVGR